MTGGIKQINQNLASLSLLGNVLAVLFTELGVDLIVIQRSCSSGRVSVSRCLATFATEIIPVLSARESVKV